MWPISTLISTFNWAHTEVLAFVQGVNAFAADEASPIGQMSSSIQTAA